MYIPHSEEETERILKTLGLSRLEDLFSHIDPSLLSEPSLPPPKSEEEIRRYIKELGGQNAELVCFAGFGAYDRIIPSAIWQILNRGEFLTAYTPYQPEASQGTLQAIFEYQSLICELTKMDVANASMYDSASALAEAILMARAIRGKGKRVVLSEGINPLYRQVVSTYLMGYRDEIDLCTLTEKGHTNLDRLENLLKDGEAHALAVQYPNFLGFVEPLREISELSKRYEVPLVVVADPIALSILKPPGEFGVDIVVRILKETQADILINYVPVGSEQAARFYAEACLRAGVSFINGMPTFIVSDPEWAKRFESEGIPVVGDDIKSQVGATILHRTLVQLFLDRGVKIDRTYQLNFGGNTDFLNMLERERLKTKKVSKTEAVSSLIPYDMDSMNIHIGPSDWVPWLKDRKIAYIRVEGRLFGDVPMYVEVKLDVEDSPNSAGSMIDAVRCCKLARDRGIGGPLYSISAYTMKHPPIQYPDWQARKMVEEFIRGERER